MAVPFDLESLEVTGESVRVVEDVMQAAFSSGAGHNTLAGQFSISGSGSLAYVPGGIHPGVERSLAWVDREGNAEDLAAPLDEYRNPRLSPDGQQLAYAEGQLGAMDVWVYDVQRQTERRLTFEGKTGRLSGVRMARESLSVPPGMAPCLTCTGWPRTVQNRSG